jgi:hypothetical protein
MQRSTAAVPLSCLALLLVTLFVAGGCANTPTLQATSTQGTGTQGTTSTCTGACTPYVSVGPWPWASGLKPGASSTFSATVHNLADNTVTWTIKEGPVGGAVTDAGVYTAPLVEGVYHVIATSKANSSLTATVTVTVTAMEFTVTGSLTTARWDHTASLLPDGQVFIAGGDDIGWDFVDSADLYDPATGTFHFAGQVSRMWHSATVLSNGDVLLAGGDVPYQLATNTADLRKAGSGVIQPTGSMTTPRNSHTATLLQDGRVLIAGGTSGASDSAKPTQTAELYDPASGKFTPAGDMTTPRLGHSAALLPNGRVLIVGGGTGAELYDPATNSFLPAPGISANRCRATATPLADGRVLIAGGSDCSNTVYTVLDTAEVYDPSTGQFTPTGKLVASEAYHTATLLPDGRVLLVGGSGTPNLGQFYDPATGSFTFGPHLIYPRLGHTATLLTNGGLLIVGGGNVGTAELYQ